MKARALTRLYYQSTHKVAFFFKILLGTCLLLTTGALCAFYIGMALQGIDSSHELAQRIVSAFGALLFAFIA